MLKKILIKIVVYPIEHLSDGKLRPKNIQLRMIHLIEVDNTLITNF